MLKVTRQLLPAFLAVGLLIAAPLPTEAAAPTGATVQTVQYYGGGYGGRGYYGRRGFYGRPRFYGRPGFYGGPRFYGPRGYGRGYYGGRGFGYSRGYR